MADGAMVTFFLVIGVALIAPPTGVRIPDMVKRFSYNRSWCLERSARQILVFGARCSTNLELLNNNDCYSTHVLRTLLLCQQTKRLVDLLELNV